MHSIYQKPADLTPLLEVCYEVAEEAHRDQPRMKIGGEIPYITHPSIVYKLLRLIGIDDEMTLAVSFLHDVLEDNKKYKSHPELLKSDLTERFSKTGIVDAAKKVHIIFEHCEELTNAAHMAEGKRGWQWEHGQKLSMRGKLVKVSDQAASLIDDILLPSDRSYEKLRKFNMKALECAKACSGSNELLSKLFKIIFMNAMDVLEGEKAGADSNKKEAAQRIRREFSLESVLAFAQQYKTPTQKEPPVKWRRHSDMATLQTGITAIGITDNNDVCRFSMLVDPEQGEESPCNKPIIKLIENLEATSRSRVSYQPLEMINGRIVRSFKLKPALAIGEFIAKAAASNAIDPSFAKQAAVQLPGQRIS